jgi:uncharacterized protein (DUF934 family)
MLDIVLAGFGETPRLEKRLSTRVDDLGEVQKVPATSEIVVPLALWQSPEAQARLAGRRVVVVLAGADDPLKLSGTLQHLSGVAIEFKAFTDGRGYSSAALLRERLGYTGEIRAEGDVLRDQAFYLQRAGFNAFVPRADRPILDFIEGFHDFRVMYQKSPVNQPLFRRREEALLALGESV